MLMALYLVIACHLNITRSMICFLQQKITDGTIDGDPPGSNDGTILRPLLSTSECIKEGTKGGVLARYLDCILLGAEPGTCDGIVLGDSLLLEHH